MADTPSTAMTREERDDFLGTGGTGVLSFAADGEEAPHTIPVSYGYDDADATFYFRLAVEPGSEKAGLLERPVSFVTYRQVDGVWHSVVATGRLERTDQNAVAAETLEGLQRVHIPLVDIFGQPPQDVPFEFYRLVPTDVTGRVESSTAP